MADPYREPNVPEAPEPAQDLDPEITTRDGHRTRALLVEAEELAGGGQRTLEHHALVRCDTCRGAGCSVCNERGATIRKSNVVVRWDAGAEEGKTVSIDGSGDIPGLQRHPFLPVLPEGRGHLLVRLGTKKSLVRTIENAERRRRKRQREYLELRASVREGVRTRQTRARGLLAVLVVVLGGLAAWVYVHKASYGESCTRPGDCRSGLCIESTGFILGKGGFTEKWCSHKCSVDADCEGGSTCTDIELNDTLGVPTGKTVRACAHK